MLEDCKLADFRLSEQLVQSILSRSYTVEEKRRIKASLNTLKNFVIVKGGFKAYEDQKQKRKELDSLYEALNQNIEQKDKPGFKMTFDSIKKQINFVKLYPPEGLDTLIFKQLKQTQIQEEKDRLFYFAKNVLDLIKEVYPQAIGFHYGHFASLYDFEMLDFFDKHYPQAFKQEDPQGNLPLVRVIEKPFDVKKTPLMIERLFNRHKEKYSFSQKYALAHKTLISLGVQNEEKEENALFLRKKLQKTFFTFITLKLQSKFLKDLQYIL